MLAVTKSGLPSASKSPVAIEYGLSPTTLVLAMAKRVAAAASKTAKAARNIASNGPRHVVFTVIVLALAILASVNE